MPHSLWSCFPIFYIYKMIILLRRFWKETPVAGFPESLSPGLGGMESGWRALHWRRSVSRQPCTIEQPQATETMANTGRDRSRQKMRFRIWTPSVLTPELIIFWTLWGPISPSRSPFLSVSYSQSPSQVQKLFPAVLFSPLPTTSPWPQVDCAHCSARSMRLGRHARDTVWPQKVHRSMRGQESVQCPLCSCSHLASGASIQYRVSWWPLPHQHRPVVTHV